MNKDSAQSNSIDARIDPLPASDDATARCAVIPARLIAKIEAASQGWMRYYRGRTYWLCCAGCGLVFDANPQQYAAATESNPTPRGTRDA